MAYHEHLKNVAIELVGRAVKEGIISRPKFCTLCGSDNKGRPICGHHEDYLKPLDVIWMCRKCHSLRHKELVMSDKYTRQDVKRDNVMKLKYQTMDLIGLSVNKSSRNNLRITPERALELSKTLKQAEIARMWGISRTRVWQLIQKAKASESGKRGGRGNRKNR